MKVGIIGSNGFVGKHLAFALNRIENIELFLFGKSNTNKLHQTDPNESGRGECQTLTDDIAAPYGSTNYRMLCCDLSLSNAPIHEPRSFLGRLLARF